MLTVAVPESTRTLPLRTLVKKLGSISKALRHMLQRRLDDSDLAVAITQMWPD
jgi:hypothetical protein